MFEDIKGIIRISKLKDRQHNDQKKKVRKDKQRSTTARDTGQRRCRHPIRNQPKYLLFFILCVN
jgi:hypothetical protein